MYTHIHYMHSKYDVEFDNVRFAKVSCLSDLQSDFESTWIDNSRLPVHCTHANECSHHVYDSYIYPYTYWYARHKHAHTSTHTRTLSACLSVMMWSQTLSQSLRLTFALSVCLSDTYSVTYIIFTPNSLSLFVILFMLACLHTQYTRCEQPN